MDERLQRRTPPALRPASTGVAVVVNLAQVHSKYLGETERVLRELFETAEREGWVLFFDEADALFDRRTEVASGHDRYAGLDTNWLLRRIEGLNTRIVPGAGVAERELKGFSVRHFPPD